MRDEVEIDDEMKLHDIDDRYLNSSRYTGSKARRIAVHSEHARARHVPWADDY